MQVRYGSLLACDCCLQGRPAQVKIKWTLSETLSELPH